MSRPEGGACASIRCQSWGLSMPRGNECRQPARFALRDQVVQQIQNRRQAFDRLYIAAKVRMEGILQGFQPARNHAEIGKAVPDKLLVLLVLGSLSGTEPTNRHPLVSHYQQDGGGRSFNQLVIRVAWILSMHLARALRSSLQSLRSRAKASFVSLEWMPSNSSRAFCSSTDVGMSMRWQVRV
jgi:hypothetical protein